MRRHNIVYYNPQRRYIYISSTSTHACVPGRPHNEHRRKPSDHVSSGLCMARVSHRRAAMALSVRRQSETRSHETRHPVATMSSADVFCIHKSPCAAVAVGAYIHAERCWASEVLPPHRHSLLLKSFGGQGAGTNAQGPRRSHHVAAAAKDAFGAWIENHAGCGRERVARGALRTRDMERSAARGRCGVTGSLRVMASQVSGDLTIALE